MTSNKIPEQVENEHIFNPPTITNNLWKQLLQMFLDGTLLAKELENYLAENKLEQEEVVTEALESFKRVGHEVKYFFERQKHTPPVLTPRTWSALKEYYLSASHVARQIEQYALSNNHLASRFRAEISIAERSFCATESELSELNEFFSHDPYQK